MSYSIRYDLVGPLVMRPDDEDELQSRKSLVTAIEAYGWAEDLGPRFAAVRARDMRNGVANMVYFDFNGPPPSAEDLPDIVARIDLVVEGLRRLSFE